MQWEWKLFADLAEVTDGRTVTVETDDDATVGDALDALLSTHPALEDRVLADDETLCDHINVLLNGEDVATGSGLATPLAAGDELAMFPPVSGG